MSGLRIQPVLTAPDRAPGEAKATDLDSGDLGPADGHDARPRPASVNDVRMPDPHAADPASANRLGVVRGIFIGLAISAVMWAGIVALVRMVL